MAHTASSSSPFTTSPHDISSRRTITQSYAQHETPLQLSPSSRPVATGSLTAERSRTRSSPVSPSTPGGNASSASSSSTSLPRPVYYPAINGSYDSVDLHQRSGDVSGNAPLIYGSEQCARLRNLSGSSSSHDYGRVMPSKRPSPSQVSASTPSPGRLSNRSAPTSPFPTQTPPALQPGGQGQAMTAARSHSLSSSSPTASTTLGHVTSSPGFNTTFSASAPPSGCNFSPRRPSLASPLPPTPIVPLILPRAAVPRSPPAPLNLAATSTNTPIRQPFHSSSGSLSSPHSASHPSPPKQLHRQHSYTPPSSNVSSSNQNHSQGWAHTQYATNSADVARAGTGGSSLPDSPSTRAMMKRLLSKPAPISNFSATSGSESEGIKGPHVKRKVSASVVANARRKGMQGSGEDTVNQRYAPDKTIAPLGQWSSFSTAQKRSENVSTATTSSEGQEKDKKTRNLLRRRPSAGNSSPRVSSPQEAASPSSRPGTLPALAKFSPLSLSPFACNQDQYFPSVSSAISQPPNPPAKTIHRSVSASAAIPVSPRQSAFVVSRSPGEVGNLSPPLPPYARASSSTSRGTSPARSPVAGPRPPLPKAAATKQTPPAGGPSKSSATPAASLVEAYKKQEREREERRIAAALERKRHQEEKAMTLGLKSQSHSMPPSRRHSLDDVNEMGVLRDSGPPARTRKQANYLGSLEPPGVRRSFVSENTSDSGQSHITPRVVANASSDALNAGTGFEAIERMAKTVSADAPATPIISQEIRLKNLSQVSSGVGVEEEELDATPYYTVFGSSSGRVVAVGGVEDSWPAYGQGYWEAGVLGRRATVTATQADAEKDKAKESLGRSLSRKVSGRWKKQGGVVVGTVKDDDAGRQGRVLGRASMQERSKAGSTPRKEDDHEDKYLQMRNRRSLRLSIDKFSDVVGKEEDERLARPASRVKATAGPVPAVPGYEGGGGRGDTDYDTERSGKLSKAKKHQTSPATTSPSGAGGSRFWKLMKRISVGGLKEKYHEASHEAPPPVPALPKDYLTLPASRSNDSSLKRQTLRDEARSFAPASSSPTSPGVTITTGPSSSIPIRQQPKISMPASSPPRLSNVAGPSQPRPSTTTRSSSPVSSSDVASSKFFPRPHSAHSSTSSFGEENPPPLPKPPSGKTFAQHIMAPSDFAKSQENLTPTHLSTQYGSRNTLLPVRRNPIADEEWTITPSPSVELASLPLPPPRRPPGNVNANMPALVDPAEPGLDGKVDIEMDRAESPTIPSFSTTEVVNAFPARRLSSALSAKSKNSPISPHAVSPTSTIAPSSLPTSLSALPPPRPLRSAQRPGPGPSASANTIFPTFDSEPAPRVQPTIFVNDVITAGRKSESHIRAHNRRSSDGLSTTSTARPRRRSSSFGATSSIRTASTRTESILTESIMMDGGRTASPPPDFTFRELDPAGPRHALTEQEKADKWDDLLQRSDRAGGTLHIAGGSRMLASDRLKFSKK